MSRSLSQHLIKFENDIEVDAKILAKVYHKPEFNYPKNMFEPRKVTAEDLARKYSEADLRELCLRTKVRVNMTLFNCLWEAKERFDKKGRLANRSEAFINAMYIKAVKRKMVIPYEPEEIERCRHVQRCRLKKRNNMRLDRWHGVESQQSQPSEQSSASSAFLDNSVEASLMLAQVPNRVQANSPNNGKAVVPIEFPVSIVSQTSLNLNSSEPELWDMNQNVSVDPINLFSDKSVPDWMAAADQINSESMTIDLDTQTTLTESQPVAEDYQVFDTQVPCTSTQSTHNTEDFL